MKLKLFISKFASMSVGIPSIQPIVHAAAKVKMYVQRTTHYMGLFRTAGIAYLVFKDWGITPLESVGLFIGSVILMMIAGFVEDYIGVIKEEQRFYSDRNPQIMECLEEIREIKERLLNEKV